jgi:hypothetical protein
MQPGGARIKQRIYILAALLLAGLLALRLAGIDQQIIKILAVAAGLLVLLLLITYRAFAGVAEQARNGTLGPPPADDEDDK